MSEQIVSYHSNGVISKIYSITAETVFEFYDNGQIHKYYRYKEDMITDFFVEYYLNGFYKEYFYTQNEKKHGAYQSYYQNGHIRTSSNYFNGLLHGLCIEYNKDGSIYSKQYYNFGKIASPHYIYYSDVFQVKYVIYYDNFEKDCGRINYYSKKQQLISTGQFKKYRKNGYYFTYHLNGVLAEKCFYKNGVLDGCLKKYNKEGDCYLRGFYRNGKRNGIFWKTDNFTIEQTRYKNDKRHGLFLLKNKSDSVKLLSLYYKNDCLDGIQIFHIKNSKRYYRENYFLVIQLKIYDSCSVCWNKCNWKTQCGHFLCVTCAEKIRQFQCPMCRHPFIKKKEVRFSYFGDFLKQD